MVKAKFRCPECGSRVVEEDGVVFCKNCFLVFSRVESVRKKLIGKRLKWKKKWPQWRKKIIASIKAYRWKPGKSVAYNPRSIKGTICISKMGNVYYRYGECKHKQ